MPQSSAFLLFFVVFDVLSVPVLGVRLENDALSLLQDKTLGPVEKVAKLLGDIRDQLEKDADEDEDLHTEYACFCKNTDKERTKLISDNTEKAAALTSEIQGLRAKSNRLSTEIDQIEKEVAGNQKALDEAIGMRKKDMAEFNAAEKSTFQSIKELDGAEAALKKLMPKAEMMQSEVTLDAESPVASALKRSLNGKHEVLWSLHNKREQEIMRTLLSHSRDLGLLQGATPGTHNAAPYQIVHGTISSLNDAFKENLAKLQEDENNDQAAHEALKKTKKEQIQAGVSLIDAKTKDMAATDQRAASARTELDDTNEDLAADTEYLAKVREQCALHEQEYATRKQTRLAELGAVTKAHYIVTHDDARDTFTRTLGHTKRSTEGKLGSRGLKEFKEERETQSMRSQTNAARKAQWGTAKRYLLLQKQSKTSRPREATKLSNLAERTEAFWKSKLFNDELKANLSSHSHAVVDSHIVSVHARQEKQRLKPLPSKNKLGLTASQMTVRKNSMANAADGVSKMMESLEVQQGEEAARKEWCVEEIHATEKAIDNKNREKDTSESILKALDVRGAELKEEIKQLGYQQEDADIELAKAGIDRRKADKIFQKTVQDQKETKKILKMALDVLKSFYDRNSKKASLLRQTAEVESNKQQTVEVVKAAAGALYGTEDSLSFSAMREQELHKEEGTYGSMAAFVQVPAADQLSFDSVRDWELQHLKGKAALLQGQGQGGRKADLNKPSPGVEKILDRANVEAADGEDLIRQGLALAKAQAAQAPVQKAMLQAPGERAPPPTNFKSYQDSAASGGLLTMIQGLIEDTEAMVEEAVKDEGDSMTGYEEYVKAANEATRKVQEMVINRRVELGKLEESAQTEKVKLKQIMAERDQLRRYDIDLYGVEGCAYLIKNYLTRFMEREEEIASLKEAMAILGVSGGNPEMTQAAHGEDQADLAEPEEEEKEEPEATGSSEHKSTPEGVQIEGPNGEKAMSKMG